MADSLSLPPALRLVGNGAGNSVGVLSDLLLRHGYGPVAGPAPRGIHSHVLVMSETRLTSQDLQLISDSLLLVHEFYRQHCLNLIRARTEKTYRLRKATGVVA